MAKTNNDKGQDIGLTEKQQNAVVKLLHVLLADEAILYIKLWKYHWNVVGEYFYSLHVEFDNQLNEIADMIDEIAEHIRQYKANAPGTMSEFKQKARLDEEPGVYPDAKTMIENLVADHEALMRFLREDIAKIDEVSGDIGAIDFLISLLQRHQKMAWILRSFLAS